MPKKEEVSLPLEYVLCLERAATCLGTLLGEGLATEAVEEAHGLIDDLDDLAKTLTPEQAEKIGIGDAD